MTIAPYRGVCPQCGHDHSRVLFHTLPDVQAAIDDERRNQWKAAITDELVSIGIYTKEHESNPRKAMGDVVEWRCRVTLDPAVSEDARELQQAAIDAALESVATDLLGIAASMQEINPESTVSYRPEVAAYRKAASLLRSRIGTNPLADLQIQRSQEIAELREEADKWHSEVEASRARIAELEDQYLSMLDWRTKCDELTRERDEARATIHISGAGVVSVDSSQMFSSAKGKKQLDELKKIHEHRKKRDKKVNLSNARVTTGSADAASADTKASQQETMTMRGTGKLNAAMRQEDK